MSYTAEQTAKDPSAIKSANREKIEQTEKTRGDKKEGKKKALFLKKDSHDQR